MSYQTHLHRISPKIVLLGMVLILFNLQLTSQVSQRSISCVSYLQVSLGANGEAELTPQMLLAQNHPDYSIFEVSIIDPPIGGNVVDCEYVGEEIEVMVTNNNTNNSCWSTVLVEDKLKPVIECSDKELACWEDTTFDDPDFFVDAISDNCTDSADIDLWYTQTPLVVNMNCNFPHSASYVRTWTATDESGNSSTCEQTIFFIRGDIDSVVFPLDIFINCPAVSVLPEDVGIPTLDGQEIEFLCMIDVQYTDNMFDLCNGGHSFKILRNWTLIDWCTGQMRMHEQLIEVKDTIPPEFTCPQDVTISTSSTTCTAAYIFPTINAEDACSDQAEIDIRFRVNGVLVFDPITYLDEGQHTIEVEAIDPCFNTSTCEYEVTVEDMVPPVLVCHNLVIGLTQDTVVTVLVENIASDFDISDNCSETTLEVRRMDDFCDNPDDLIYGPTIDLCCEDVNNVTTVEVRATDASGNSNSCMFTIDVQDKNPPVITHCPDSVQINCDDEMEDFSVYGEAEAEGGCIITFEEIIEIELDECGEGEITRTIVATNGGGLTDTCVQIITVVNPFDFSLEDDIIWPDSIEITECDPDLHPDSLESKPQIAVDHCSMVFSIFYEDSIVNDLENCETVFRTWTVVDSCNANESMSQVQVITIDLPEGPEVTVEVDTTAEVECPSQAVDPEMPTVTDACGEEIFPTSSSIFDDPSPIECEGTRTYTYTYVDCSGNSLDWTFIYTIQRTTPPSEVEGPVPSQATVECLDSIAEPGELPFVLDVCGNILEPIDTTITENPSPLECEGQVIYTYTYEDCAGLVFTWNFTYTVDLQTPPTVPENGEANVQCLEDAEEPVPPVVVDHCGNEVSSDLESVEIDTLGNGVVLVTYIFTYTDCAGNETDWQFVYTVEDTVPPTIECPEDIIVGTDPGECYATEVDLGEADADDNCGFDTVIVNAPDTFELGPTIVIYTAFDLSGNTDSCEQTVVVVDNEDPEVICPDDIVIENEEDECQVEVTWNVPVPTDNCVVDTLIASHESGDTFPIGITVVTYIVIDGAGNSDTCSFSIEVLGGDPLTLECPDDVEVENDTAECGADLTIELPSASGGCGMLTITNDFNSQEAADGFYPVGTTTVTYTVTDENGNEASCEFTVTVEDNEDPVILDCPEDQIVDTDTTECSAVVEWLVPEADDNCPGVILTSTHQSGDNFPLGTTIVVYTATDASGNSVECSFEVTVEDNEAPVVICPDDIVIDNEEGECDVEVFWNIPEPTDNCVVDTLIASHEPGDTFPIGITVITYIVIDGAGNADTCSFTIEVLGADPLAIDCPDDIVAENDTAECGADLEVGLPTVNGGCGMLTITNDFNNEEVADGFYPVGTTTVTYTVTDENGNEAMCEFTVTVEDHEDPVILDCPEDQTVDTDTSECFAVVEWDIPEAEDNCPGVILTSTHEPGDTFELGTTVVIYTATDTSGNSVECSFEVTVEDNEAPEVICPNDIVEDNLEDECEVAVTWNVPVPTDNCGVDTLIASHEPGDTFPVGITEVTYIVIDESGNSDTCSFTIEVLGTDPLTIECPDDIVAENDTTECGADLTIPLPTVSGGCGMLTITNDFNNEEAADGFYPVGTTTVTYTVMDENGHPQDCQFTVTVNDTEDPVILNCPAEIVVDADVGECIAAVEWTLPTAEDNCPGVELTSTHEPGDTFVVGIVTVTYTATDSSGNSVECSFEVAVEDAEDPVFTFCPADTTVSCQDYEENIDLSQFGEAEAEDNCLLVSIDEVSTVDVDTCTQTGTITREFTATDDAGNTAQCIQIITFEGKSVLDSLDFIWPDSVFSVEGCVDFHVDSIPEGSAPELDPGVETCNDYTVVNDDLIIESDTMCDQILRTWIVTDVCNNTVWEFEQILTVEDTTPPEFINVPDTLEFYLTEDSCEIFVNLELVVAEDQCGFEVKVTNDSPFSDSDGADASGVYPVGTTDFSYFAENHCGVVAEFEFTIIVRDTITPDIDCVKEIVSWGDSDTLVVSIYGGIVSASDNCTDSINLIITLDPNDPGLDSLVIPCDSLNLDAGPDGHTLFDYWIYVIDEFGNIDSCKGSLRVDHNEVCDFPGGLHLNGSLFTFDDEAPIGNGQVFVESGGGTWETISDKSGFFEFLDLEYREDMWLKPFKDDDPLNGVTTFDIFLMQRHILGINVITNPYYLIAGDINNDGRINIQDIAELRRLILGTYNQFPNNTSWRFLDTDFIVPYGVMPTQIDLPESVLIEPGNDRLFNQDFVGIKIGDLNGNAIGSPANSQHSITRSGPHPLEAVDRIFKAGEVVRVGLRLTDMNRINGIQFELLWDSDYLNIQDVVLNQNIASLSDIYNISYRDEFGSMALSVSSVHPIALEKEDFIVEIQFTAQKEGVLSDALKLDSERVVPEVFDGLRDLRLLELVFVDRIGEDGNRFELFQNRPNPFTGNTLIPFVIPSDGETTLQLFNVAGKLIWNTSQNLPAGKHQFELDAGNIGLIPGVYYYQLSTGNHVAVKKMVVN